MTPLIALVDDHVLMRNGIAALLQKLNFTIVFEADDGTDMMSKISAGELPDIILMDIMMPNMDGFEATSWLRANFPSIKVLALSMYDNEKSILKMIRSGAKGYLLKDAHPSDLQNAITSVLLKGYYQSEVVTGKLIYSVNKMDVNSNSDTPSTVSLTDREKEFLVYACTEMTYKEIAEKMNVSPRTVDGYREDLFRKLEVKSRIGLVLFAIKEGLFKVN